MWIYADTLEEVTDMETELSIYFRSDDIAENLTNELLNECYPTYEIGGIKFCPSEVVRKLARPLYNQIMEEEIERTIANDLYWLERVNPNDGDKLGDFVTSNIDYIIWKGEK